MEPPAAAPALLTLELTLQRGREVLDRRQVRFGLKKLEIKDGQFVLNGDKIFVTDGDTQRVLSYTGMNISSFGEDEEGELYVVDYGGTVHRIESMPEICTFPLLTTPDGPRHCVSRR